MTSERFAALLQDVPEAKLEALKAMRQHQPSETIFPCVTREQHRKFTEQMVHYVDACSAVANRLRHIPTKAANTEASEVEGFAL